MRSGAGTKRSPLYGVLRLKVEWGSVEVDTDTAPTRSALLCAFAALATLTTRPTSPTPLLIVIIVIISSSTRFVVAALRVTKEQKKVGNVRLNSVCIQFVSERVL